MSTHGHVYSKICRSIRSVPLELVKTYLRIGWPLVLSGENTSSNPLPNWSSWAWKVSAISFGHMENDKGVDGSRDAIDGSLLRSASKWSAFLAIVRTSGFPGLKCGVVGCRFRKSRNTRCVIPVYWGRILGELCKRSLTDFLQTYHKHFRSALEDK